LIINIAGGAHVGAGDSGMDSDTIVAMTRIFGALEGPPYLLKFLEYAFSLGRALEK
jgi:hypothetical protein